MDKYNTQEEIYAIIIGVLAKEEGKITLTRFNKIIENLGLDKMNMLNMQDTVTTIREDAYLNSLKNKAIAGELTLEHCGSVDNSDTYKGNDYHNKVSTYFTENEKVLSQLREIRKHNREGAHLQLLMNDLKHELVHHLDPDTPLLATNDMLVDESDKELVILLSDFHVGAINSDYTHGGYDFSVLKNRINQLLKEVVKTIEEVKPEKVTVYFVGDLVEHISMRDVNQAFETEFTLAEQISKGTRLLIDVLTTIKNNFSGEVRFGIVGGNHDRLQGSKNQKVYNDNVAYIVLDTLHLLNGIGQLPVTLINNLNDIYTIRDTVANKNIVINHGDGLKGKGNNITKFITDYHIDLLITGHLLHLSVTQEDFNRMHIIASSPMGYNNYAKELHLSKTKPSQQIIILEKDTQNIAVKTVFLD